MQVRAHPDGVWSGNLTWVNARYETVFQSRRELFEQMNSVLNGTHGITFLESERLYEERDGK